MMPSDDNPSVPTPPVKQPPPAGELPGGFPPEPRVVTVIATTACNVRHVTWAAFVKANRKRLPIWFRCSIAQPPPRISLYDIGAQGKCHQVRLRIAAPGRAELYHNGTLMAPDDPDYSSFRFYRVKAMGNWDPFKRSGDNNYELVTSGDTEVRLEVVYADEPVPPAQVEVDSVQESEGYPPPPLPANNH